jgi:hypothetical protein
VWREKIKPQAVDLERKIEASNRSLKRKLLTGVSIDAGSAAIGGIVGAVTGTVGGSIGAGIGVVAGAIATLPKMMPYISKFFDERQDFEGSGAYFLWKAGRVRSH